MAIEFLSLSKATDLISTLSMDMLPFVISVIRNNATIKLDFPGYVKQFRLIQKLFKKKKPDYHQL